MKKTNKKGFTIVELVIVIAVIAILSAVLIPTFGTVISDANEVAGKQEARNKYLACYQEDIKDGVADAKIGNTAMTDAKYSVVTGKTGVTQYEYTDKSGKTFIFDGTNYTGTGIKAD